LRRFGENIFPRILDEQSEAPQPTTSDANNDNLLTEEQFNERLAAEKPLQDTIDALGREVSDAAEASHSNPRSM
jgi:hypothetical protein